MTNIPKITPFLWFDNQAEEAANFYVSIFQNSKILNIVRNPAGAMGPEGEVMVAAFELDGTKFTALNGGPLFKFSEAISFVINCEDQAEVDYFWDKLSVGGAESRCGWLRDKFGLSWQVVPSALRILLSDPDRAKAARVNQAMMQMTKIDIASLEKAAE